MKSLFAALPSILLVSYANTIIKYRIDILARNHSESSLQRVMLYLRDPLVLSGIATTAISICWWVYIMPKVKLSVVYPIIQVGIIGITTLAATYILGERVTTTQLSGIMFFIIGILLVSRG